MWADDASRSDTIGETVGVVPQISACRSAIQTGWERHLLKTGISKKGAFVKVWALLAMLLVMSLVTAWGGRARFIMGM